MRRFAVSFSIKHPWWLAEAVVLSGLVGMEVKTCYRYMQEASKGVVTFFISHAQCSIRAIVWCRLRGASE